MTEERTTLSEDDINYLQSLIKEHKTYSIISIVIILLLLIGSMIFLENEKFVLLLLLFFALTFCVSVIFQSKNQIKLYKQDILNGEKIIVSGEIRAEKDDGVNYWIGEHQIFDQKIDYFDYNKYNYEVHFAVFSGKVIYFNRILKKIKK